MKRQGIGKIGACFLGFISSMRSFIACCISGRRSRTQIGFDQFPPSACQQEIWVTRLSSQKGVDVTSGAQFAALPLVDRDFELHAPSLPSRQQEIWVRDNRSVEFASSVYCQATTSRYEKA